MDSLVVVRADSRPLDLLRSRPDSLVESRRRAPLVCRLWFHLNNQLDNRLGSLRGSHREDRPDSRRDNQLGNLLDNQLRDRRRSRLLSLLLRRLDNLQGSRRDNRLVNQLDVQALSRHLVRRFSHQAGPRCNLQQVQQDNRRDDHHVSRLVDLRSNQAVFRRRSRLEIPPQTLRGNRRYNLHRNLRHSLQVVLVTNLRCNHPRNHPGILQASLHLFRQGNPPEFPRCSRRTSQQVFHLLNLPRGPLDNRVDSLVHGQVCSPLRSRLSSLVDNPVVNHHPNLLQLPRDNQVDSRQADRRGNRLFNRRHVRQCSQQLNLLVSRLSNPR